ncbi:hypothetical protein F53441_13130 [Fusarium austroafricanum]|uniref:Uncharacterized protein n=1 Tax=Fusarium austroafricanum TaxID=2364996 RepID=A0A8H4JSA7_9HYPO|nr:hypothetical protein F53441_13130 [Fusarium austroafricanum]
MIETLRRFTYGKAFSAVLNATNGRAKNVLLGNLTDSHARVWSKLLNDSILNTKGTVNIMTKQLDDVEKQLVTQFQLLRDKLTGLQNTLKVQKESLSKLTAAFWGMVVGAIVVIAIGIIALVAGVPSAIVLSVGSLFLGGLIASIIISVLKISQLAEQIAQTEAYINFWGRMATDANTLKTMDDATAELLGMEILEDTSIIIAAQGVKTEVQNAATIYLDTLNKQGVHISSLVSIAATQENPRTRLLRALNVSSVEQLEDSFHDTIKAANSKISSGDTSSYEMLMEKAFSFELQRKNATTLAHAQTGLRYDIARINDASKIFNSHFVTAQTSVPLYGDIIIDTSDVDNGIRSASPVVVGLLRPTGAMCHKVQDILKRYKEAPSGDKGAIVKLRDTLLQDAINACISAQTSPPVPTTLLQMSTMQLPTFKKAWNAILRAELSGATVNGHAVTWIETVRTISGCLGGIYNILTAVQGQVLEDPTDYYSLLSQTQANLDQIKTNLDEVNGKIDELEKQERDLFLNLIANIVILVLTGAALLAGYDFLSPLSITLSAAEALGLGLAASATAEIQDNIEFVKGTKLTVEDAEAIGRSWGAVKTELIAWMDIVNTQDIAPASGHAAISMVFSRILCTYTNAFNHSDGISPHSNGRAPDVINMDVGNHQSHQSQGHDDLDPSDLDNQTLTVEQTPGLDRRASKDLYLRVMLLGASIAQGYKSSDGNGYHKWLRAQL